MLTKELGFVTSRLAACLGFFALLRLLLTEARDIPFYFAPGARFPWPTLAAGGAVVLLLTLATFMTCAYLWFRADSFGGQGTSQVHPSVAIDGQSLRSAASFGLGLYFAFSGLVNLTGYIVQVLFVPSTLPAFRRAVAWNAVSDIVELVVGVALVLIGGHPKLFGNIAKIARADFMIDEK